MSYAANRNLTSVLTTGPEPVLAAVRRHGDLVDRATAAVRDRDALVNRTADARRADENAAAEAFAAGADAESVTATPNLDALTREIDQASGMALAASNAVANAYTGLLAVIDEHADEWAAGIERQQAEARARLADLLGDVDSTLTTLDYCAGLERFLANPASPKAWNYNNMRPQTDSVYVGGTSYPVRTVIASLAGYRQPESIPADRSVAVLEVPTETRSQARRRRVLAVSGAAE